MAVAVPYEEGYILRQTSFTRVVFYSDREQPFTVWGRWNGGWKVLKFGEDENAMMNYAIAYDGGEPEVQEEFIG